MDSITSNPFFFGKAVLDLTPYFEKEPSWRDGFMKAGLEPFATQGRYYGVPYRINGKFFVYNKKMFEDNGLKEPEIWTEFTAGRT